jgi:predicted RNase H-like HicB family nuclease
LTVRVTFTAVYEPVENGWIQARLAELPGVITAAPTLEQAKELLADALREYLLALGQTGAASAPPANGAARAGALELVINAA